MTTPPSSRKSNTNPQNTAKLRGDVNVLIQKVNYIEETLKELKRLQGDIGQFETNIEKLSDVLDGVNPTDLNAKIERVILILDGDPTKDVIGLRTRVRQIEATTDKIMAERNAIKWMLVGLGLTSVTNLGAILTLIAKATTGGG